MFYSFSLPGPPDPHNASRREEGSETPELLMSIFGLSVSCVDSKSKISDSAKFQVLVTLYPCCPVPKPIRMADPQGIFTQPEAEMAVHLCKF